MHRPQRKLGCLPTGARHEVSHRAGLGPRKPLGGDRPLLNWGQDQKRRVKHGVVQRFPNTNLVRGDGSWVGPPLLTTNENRVKLVGSSAPTAAAEGRSMVVREGGGIFAAVMGGLRLPLHRATVLAGR